MTQKENMADPNASNDQSVPPMTETERAVAPIWSEILQRPRIAPSSDFFALGGDSMTMMMILFKVNESLGVELPPGILSDTPTLAQFCELIDQRLGERL